MFWDAPCSGFYRRPHQKHSAIFGALPAADKGIDDLEESFKLGGVFPMLDLGRPKVSKNQVSVKISLKNMGTSVG